MKKKWSDKEVRYLTKAWTEGVSVKTIKATIAAIPTANPSGTPISITRNIVPNSTIISMLYVTPFLFCNQSVCNF